MAPLGQAPALSVNSKLGWIWLKMANTLAYYGAILIMALKCFKLEEEAEKRLG